MYVEFTFIEQQTLGALWLFSDAYVIVNGKKADFGNFLFDNGTRFESGLSNGIYWSRVSEPTDGIQNHKVKLFLNSDVITPGEPFELRIGSDAPYVFSVDDFVIQEDSRDTLIFNNSAVSSVLPVLRSIDIPGLNETATGASFLNSAAVALDALVSDMNNISAQFDGRSLGSLTDTNMRDIANALINGFESWYEPGATSQGFEDWSEELWDSFAKQFSTSNSIASPLFIAGSILGFASLFTPAGLTAIAALTASTNAAGSLFTAIKLQAPNEPDLDELPELTTIDLIGTLVKQMKASSSAATREVGQKLENTAVEAYKAYVDFATNTQLATHITRAINDEVQSPGIEYIRSLGYTVDFDFRPGGPKFNDRWDIDITKGAVDLGTSRISYIVERNDAGEYFGSNLQIA